VATFNDNFEAMAATTPGVNPPTGYFLEGSPIASYLTGTGWYVRHAGSQYAEKTGFVIAETGYIEIEFEMSAVTGISLVFENSANPRDPNVPYIRLSSYFDQSEVGINGSILATYGIAKNTRVRFRIDRSNDSYRFRIWVDNVSIHDGTSVSTFPIEGIPRFYHAESPMIIYRFAGDDGITPPPPSTGLIIVKDPTYNLRHFESYLNITDPDFSSNFESDGTNYPVGYDFTDGLQGWIKSPSSAINTEIQTNGSFTWNRFAQYGYQGGQLTKVFPEQLFSIDTGFYLPSYTVSGSTDAVGVKLRNSTTSTYDSEIKIVIDRNSVEVLEFDGGTLSYNSLLVVDISTEAVGSEVFIYFFPGSVQISAGGIPTLATLTTSPTIDTIEFFTENTTAYPLNLDIRYVGAYGAQRKNLNLQVPSQIAAEYLPGDILLVSVHEGDPYGGSSIVPRISGQFEPVTATKLASPDSYGYQRFWARTMTASEPTLYQFARGDSDSFYDSPTCVGFIVRGCALEDLAITFSSDVTGTTSYPLTLSSSSCNAVLGDLVYGYVQNNESSQMYSAVPAQDLLWYQGSPHGVTSLREAVPGDDGIVRFALLYNTELPYNVFAARIFDSSAVPPTPTPTCIGNIPCLPLMVNPWIFTIDFIRDTNWVSQIPYLPFNYNPWIFTIPNVFNAEWVSQIPYLPFNYNPWIFTENFERNIDWVSQIPILPLNYNPWLFTLDFERSEGWVSQIPAIANPASLFRLVAGATTLDLPSETYPKEATPKANVKAFGVPGSSKLYYVGDGLPEDNSAYVLKFSYNQKQNPTLLADIEALFTGLTKVVYLGYNPTLYLDVETFTPANTSKRIFIVRQESLKQWFFEVEIYINVKSKEWKRTDNNLKVGTVL
jgi:hypothetical protein